MTIDKLQSTPLAAAIEAKTTKTTEETDKARALGAARSRDSEQAAAAHTNLTNEVTSLPVKLSAMSQNLMQAFRVASDGKESFDARKVERLRREIMEGRFPIDEERLARKVMELEQQLGDLGRE